MNDDAFNISHLPPNAREREARRLLRVGIRANIPDQVLVTLVQKGIQKGKHKRVNALTSAQIVRESLEFIVACGYRRPPQAAIDDNPSGIGSEWNELRSKTKRCGSVSPSPKRSRCLPPRYDSARKRDSWTQLKLRKSSKR